MTPCPAPSLDAGDSSSVDPRHDLLWRVRLSSLYHLKRERFMDGADKISKMVSVLAGAAAFAHIKNSGGWGDWFTAIITVVSTVSLVYGFSAKARKHAELSQSFKRLEAKVIAAGKKVTISEIDAFEAEFLIEEASEPCRLGALVTSCHNELCVAYGWKKEITPLPLHQVLLKNWLDFDQSELGSDSCYGLICFSLLLVVVVFYVVVF